jgi:hypothetical protein
VLWPAGLSYTRLLTRVEESQLFVQSIALAIGVHSPGTIVRRRSSSFLATQRPERVLGRGEPPVKGRRSCRASGREAMVHRRPRTWKLGINPGGLQSVGEDNSSRVSASLSIIRISYESVTSSNSNSASLRNLNSTRSTCNKTSDAAIL